LVKSVTFAICGVSFVAFFALPIVCMSCVMGKPRSFVIANGRVRFVYGRKGRRRPKQSPSPVPWGSGMAIFSGTGRPILHLCSSDKAHLMTGTRFVGILWISICKSRIWAFAYIFVVVQQRGTTNGETDVLLEGVCCYNQSSPDAMHRSCRSLIVAFLPIFSCGKDFLLQKGLHLCSVR
jgi:hypothetical protein